MKAGRFLLSMAMAGACLWTLEVAAEEGKPVYPGKKWELKKPGQMGLDGRKLKAMSDYAGGFGCVVRGGYMVYTWGDASKAKDVASAVKPVYTHFLLKAVEQGKLKSVDEAVSKKEPRLKSLNKGLGYKDREITWRHLCNQVSCYGVRERPGRAFDYSDYNMALFFDSLFLKVYGTTWERVDGNVLRPGLTDLLGCEDKPTFMAFGTKNRPGRLAISPRDFARFALLYLRKGKWKDKQLISAKSAAMAVRSPLATSIPRTKGERADMIAGQRSIGGGNNQCDHNGSYSFAWWVNGIGRDGKRNWPDVQGDVYGCFGHGDIRAMVVMPGLDLIVCWNDSRIKGSKMVNQALRLLKEAAGNKAGERK
ncbi:MAG: serine hydrolase [Planctomycetes bacterium]|nr:serine hydrolase [Planctomycetota bacterium]